MNLSPTIGQIRRQLSKHKKALATFCAGWVVGLILTPSTFGAVANLFDSFSRQTVNRVCLSLLLLLSVTVPWIILLKNKIKSYQKHLKEFDLNFDIDKQDEYDEAWEEADKLLEHDKTK